MNISKLHNLAEVLLANANTRKQCAGFMDLFYSETAAFGRNLTQGIIDAEVHAQQVMREVVRTYQRLQSLAEYWGVSI